MGQQVACWNHAEQTEIKYVDEDSEMPTDSTPRIKDLWQSQPLIREAMG